MKKECQEAKYVLVEAYKDVVSPAAKHVGAALETIFKIGLSPFAALDFKFEKLKEELKNKVIERQKSIPETCRCDPPDHIAFPVIMSITMSSDIPDLRCLYEELLLKSMDTRTQSTVHPSFIRVVEQITPQEAVLLISFKEIAVGKGVFYESFSVREQSSSIKDQFYRHCKKLGLSESEKYLIWLDNLDRLKLIEVTDYNESKIEKDHNSNMTGQTRSDYSWLRLTDYGCDFVEACTPPNNTDLN